MAALAATRESRVRALAVTSAARSPLAPDLPAVSDTLPGFVVESWLAITGPRGLGHDVLATLEAAAIGVARDPSIAARLQQHGATPIGSTSAQLAARIRAEDAMWGPLVRRAGVRGE